jgi:DNA replication protein DnaC
MSDLWRRCLQRLESDLTVEDLHTYLKPLQASEDSEGLRLLAPNGYTLDIVKAEFLPRIQTIAASTCTASRSRCAWSRHAQRAQAPRSENAANGENFEFEHNLDPSYTFESFVEGKSNQLGKAAAVQVANNPGRAYNPLLLYGGTGLGKTHLMHAAGNHMRAQNAAMKVMYLRSEQFVSAMIDSLRTKSMDDFKRRFRAVDALLIDDIQFLAGKNTSQEEFFHTFNALFDGKQQIILTCDRYPKEVDNLEPRLKSTPRLGPFRRDRSAGLRDARRNPVEQGGVARRGNSGAGGATHCPAHALECARSGRRAQYSGGARKFSRPADQRGLRPGDAARSADRAQSVDHDLEHPEDRGGLLSVALVGLAVDEPQPLAGAAAADGDGADQGIDRT